MRAVGVKPQSYDYRDLRTGKMLYQAPLGDEAAGRYGAPMYNIHRADLVQLLFDAVPPEAKKLGAKCVSRVAGQGRRRGDAAERRDKFAAMCWSAATAFTPRSAVICAARRKNISPTS